MRIGLIRRVICHRASIQSRNLSFSPLTMSNDLKTVIAEAQKVIEIIDVQASNTTY